MLAPTRKMVKWANRNVASPLTATRTGGGASVSTAGVRDILFAGAPQTGGPTTRGPGAPNPTAPVPVPLSSPPGGAGPDIAPPSGGHSTTPAIMPILYAATAEDPARQLVQAQAASQGGNPMTDLLQKRRHSA
jgi:hypothetical protein